MTPHKKSNVANKGYVSHFVEQRNKGNGIEPLKCWTCGGNHHKIYSPLYQGGMPQIYIAQKV